MRDSFLSWQKVLAQGFSSAKELLHFLSLSPELSSIQAEKHFKTRVPRGFAARMQAGNPRDPLLLQVLASEEELLLTDAYVSDPLQEAGEQPVPGLLHKYQGRVLLILTGVCAINCRFCFRRHFPYQDNNPGREGWQLAMDYIRADETIHEVILSGGDPLLAADDVLTTLIQQLEIIPHVETLRFHTRIPIVLPERITEEFLTILAASRLQKVMVVHCNHPQELDESVAQACFLLRQAGCHLLNQSVLLKGINDDALVLAQLCKRLFTCGVMPYYLHLLDKVDGTAHFDLPHDKALAIYQQLQQQLPGYLLPRLAREEPGKASKTIFV